MTLGVIASSGIADVLAGIAETLQVPVLACALLALAACAIELGRYAAERWFRARIGAGGLRALARRAIAEPDQARTLCGKAPNAMAARVVVELAQGCSQASAAEESLANYELAVQRRLDRTRILVRAGPALGLMGTLIPLTPGLTALGRGNLKLLASDLRTAFSATVVGLLVGTVSYALTISRTRIYTEDLDALERAAGSPRAAEPSSPAAAATFAPAGASSSERR